MRSKSFLLLLAVLLCGCTMVPVSELASAAREGDAHKIRRLIHAGADPNEPSGVNGWPPLAHAIHKNQFGAVRTLLEAGVDPNATFGDGEFPLLMAAGYGQTDIVEELLKHKANPRQREAHQGSALDAALLGSADIDRVTVGKCQTATVRLLLECAPDIKPNLSFLGRTIRDFKKCPEIDRLLKQAEARK